MSTEPLSPRPEIEPVSQNQPACAAEGACPDGDTSATRRRLLRAGLAAGPVLLAVKSRSVLACGGSYGGGGGTKPRITCSAFASIKAAKLHGTVRSHAPNGGGHWCKSHIEWRDCAHPGKYADKKNCFFHKASYKKKRTTWKDCRAWGMDPSYGPTSSWSSYSADWRCKYAGFERKRTDHDDRTLQEMLYSDDALARHLVAVCLNKAGGFDPDNFLPSEKTCQQIWKNNGVWTPPGCSTQWSRQDTLEWFDTCFGTCSV